MSVNIEFQTVVRNKLRMLLANIMSANEWMIHRVIVDNFPLKSGKLSTVHIAYENNDWVIVESGVSIENMNNYQISLLTDKIKSAK
ncbi:MAG: hypothetical protein WC055_09990 [Melioribacteraceae bacterium]